MVYSGNNFDIKKKIYEVLKSEPNRRLVARDIAQKIEELYPDDCAKKKVRPA